MWKKLSLGIMIALFFLGTLAMIGWIGFQERIRLAVQALEQDGEETKAQTDEMKEADPKSEDHTQIETKEEAEKVIKRLEGFTRTLEEDNLPTE